MENRRSQGVRLQKYLSERGVASRRRAAELISAGHVQVDGITVTEAGHRVLPGRSRVLFDGRPVAAERSAPRTIALHKPRGYICSTTSRQGRTVFDLLPELSRRLVPAGRLDKNSEGLLLLSDDGDLINRVTHPRYGHEKTYHVTVSGKLDDKTLRHLRSRMLIDGHRIRPARVRVLDPPPRSGMPALNRACTGSGPSRSVKPRRVRLEFILREGRNRQIREMCRAVSLRVHRLVRVAIGNLTLAGLESGQWRDLTAEEVARLKSRPPRPCVAAEISRSPGAGSRVTCAGSSCAARQA
jgi:pseudouridine synthase